MASVAKEQHTASDNTWKNNITDQLIDTAEQYAIAGLPPHPIVADRASGAYIWDKDDNKYIDLIAGYSSVNQGHCHPKIVKAMMDQCQKVMLPGYCVYNDQYPVLCKKLCELLGFEMAAATNSGSEAIDLAIRIARKWGRQVKSIPAGETMILTASKNYHGRTMLPLSSSENASHTEGSTIRLPLQPMHLMLTAIADLGPFIPNVGSSVTGQTVHFGSTSDLETAFASHGDRIAAFMIETVEGNAGTVVPPAGYLQAVRRLCSQYNVLFIADEIQCGFGRTGYFMAYDAEGVKPDLVVLGKALTGGAYSMGMVLGGKETLGLYKPGQFGSTFAGNPLACACAIAAVDVLLDEDLTQRTQRLGLQAEKRLSAIESPYYGGWQGRGLFFSLFVRDDAPPRVTAKRWAKLLMERGVLTQDYGDRIRLAPPMCVEEADLWWAIDEMERALGDLETIDRELHGRPLG